MRTLALLALFMLSFTFVPACAQEEELPKDWVEQLRQWRASLSESKIIEEIAEEESIDPSKVKCDCLGATLTAAEAYYKNTFKKMGVVASHTCKERVQGLCSEGDHLV